MKLSNLLLLTTFFALPSLQATTQMIPEGATTTQTVVETFQPVTVKKPFPVDIDRSQSPKESAPADTYRITINTNDQAHQVLPDESSDWTELRGYRGSVLYCMVLGIVLILLTIFWSCRNVAK